MKNRISKLQALCFFILQFLLCAHGKTQDFSRMLEKADTLNFSVPKTNDWQLLNSYVAFNSTRDSVLLELVVLSDQKNIDWKNEQYIGQIKQDKFFSKTERVALCYLLNDVYKLKVEPNGKCYLSLAEGNPPAGFPAVIPLRISYGL